MLGLEVAQSTVSKYMMRVRNPPSQSWKTFLRNHADAIAAIDMCVVPVTFELLFAVLVLGHDRRQLLWFACRTGANDRNAGPSRQGLRIEFRGGVAYRLAFSKVIISLRVTVTHLVVTGGPPPAICQAA
jgi:hypothetical protein